VISTVLSVYVLAPRSSLDFALSGPTAYEHFVASGVDIEEAYRTLSYWIQDARETNQGSIDRLVRVFRLACAALVLAIGVFSTGLAVH
jgi:hypothetical protein